MWEGFDIFGRWVSKQFVTAFIDNAVAAGTPGLSHSLATSNVAARSEPNSW